ncbi:UNVERIFIED_CONTAM: hypothetical protein FKN15_007281 [Acipenser sinensis]
MAAPLITGVLIRDKRFLRWVGETLEFRWLLNKDPELQVHEESSVPHSLTVSTVTVTGVSGIVSVSQSFGSFGRYYKSIIPARDAKSNSIKRPNFSNPKVW